MQNLYKFAVLFFLIASPSVLHAQPMQAELKVGGVLDVQVDEVTAWGFWLDSGQGLLFRQLVYVKTPSDSLAQIIVSFLPEATVEQNGGLFTVRLADLNVPAHIPKSRKALRELTLFAGPFLGSRIGLETTMNIRTRYSGPLHFQLGTNIGWPVIGGGFLGGLTAGTGIEVPVSTFEVMLIANVWVKYLQDVKGHLSVREGAIIDEGTTVEDGTTVKDNAYSISLFIKRPATSLPYDFHFGVRYFIKDIELNTSEVPFAVVLGLSTTL